MGAAQNLKFYTEEDYFAMEESSDVRHEYVSGEVVAMAGGTTSHSRIIRNAQTVIDNATIDGPCELFNSELRIGIEAAGTYTYPDISVVCGEQRYKAGRAEDTLLNPTLIIEALSKSTQHYDRGDKFRRYRLIPSLKQYVLISSLEVMVEIFTRTSVFLWDQKVLTNMDDTLELESIGVKLKVVQLYRSVVFPSSDDGLLVAEPDIF